MAATKIYGAIEKYETKLERVMERLGVSDWDYSPGRKECWVVFTYKGERYQFAHSLEKAQKQDPKIRYGSDVFAQLVLALEDLARLAERGIYDLQQWMAGMRLLPEPLKLPPFLIAMGFDRAPTSEAEIKTRYQELAKAAHPDSGGSDQAMVTLTANYQAALAWLGEAGGP